MAFLPLLLAAGCIFITDDEYQARIATTLSGEVRTAEALLVPDEAALSLIPAAIGAENLYTDALEPSLTAPVSGLGAGQRVDFEISVPSTVEADQLIEIDPQGAPGMMGVVYGLGLWVDEDEDGVATTADSYYGVSGSRLLAWIEAPDPSWADMGATAGYNFLTYDMARNRVLGVTPVASTWLSWNLDANLAQVQQAALTAEVERVPTLARRPRLDLYAYQGFQGADDPTLTSVSLEETTDPQTVTLELPSPPFPDSHFSDELDGEDLSALGVRLALYYGVAYDDGDDDGTWDRTGGISEIPFSTSADEDGGRAALYITPTSFAAAEVVDVFGSMGWQLLEYGGSGDQTLDWDEGLLLEAVLGR
ncbi:MAG: hypothetical protein H6739_02320 [Alphaproteobacteria bacterium]|nr:hypothetical protein [Alphaproteobacteria bacterium]